MICKQIFCRRHGAKKQFILELLNLMLSNKKTSANENLIKTNALKCQLWTTFLNITWLHELKNKCFGTTNK